LVSRPRPPAITTEFVDRGAARQRLGLLVVPYLNGEGSVTNYVINADIVVEAAVQPAVAGGSGVLLTRLLLGGAGPLLAAVGGGVLYIRASVVDGRPATG
jgi:hypothetical protein